MTVRTVSLEALQAGAQVTVAPGDTLRVVVSFKYTVAANTTALLRAAPYAYTLGVLDRVNSCVAEVDVDLPAATTPTAKEATVDIYILSKADGGPTDGTYGLIAEFPGYDLEEHIDNAIIIEGNKDNWSELLGTVMMIMMMGMMVGMVKQ